MKHYNLVNSEKKAPVICFIEQRSFRDFIKNYIKDNPGEIQTLDGNQVSTEAFIFTLLAEKGLRIGG